MAVLIKDLVKSFIHQKKDWKIDLLYQWPEIIGPLGDKVRIEKIYDNLLILGVFHPCWLQELSLLSPLLLQTINKKLNHNHIKQLRFQHVCIKKNIQKKQIKNNDCQKKSVRLTYEDEYTLKKITDHALRDALKAFRIRCYQEK